MTCLDFAHATAVFDLNSFLKGAKWPWAPPAHTVVWWQRSVEPPILKRPPQHPAMPAPPHRTQNTQVCALERTKRWNSEPVGVQGTFLTPPYSSFSLAVPLTTPELHIPQTFSFLLCFKQVFMIKIWWWPWNRQIGENRWAFPNSRTQKHTMNVCWKQGICQQSSKHHKVCN